MLEKHLVNPPNRLALRLGIAPRAFALLETKGCRTGNSTHTPVGIGSAAGTIREGGAECRPAADDRGPRL